MVAAFPLTYRPELPPSFVDMLEADAIALAHAVRAEIVPGDWQPSEAVDTYRPLLETLVTAPGWVRRFHRTFIADGRINFPDAPAPKMNYLQWERLPRSQMIPGALKLLRMGVRLYRRQPFYLSDLDDPCAGSPTCFHIPRTPGDLLIAIARRWFTARMRSPRFYRVTEASIRHFYYRAQIERVFGREFDTILEIGGGFGGLCAEVLAHCGVRRFIVVELPDCIPICWFYLSSLFDCRVQALFGLKDELDPEVRIAIVAPWALPSLNCSVDVAINTMSFQHMTRDNLHYYFDELDRLETSRMYLVNRNEVRDRSDVIIDDYPIPPRFRLIEESDYLFSPARPWIKERFYASR